jgi:hypothetical protein
MLKTFERATPKKIELNVFRRNLVFFELLPSSIKIQNPTTATTFKGLGLRTQKTRRDRKSVCGRARPAATSRYLISSELSIFSFTQSSNSIAFLEVRKRRIVSISFECCLAGAVDGVLAGFAGLAIDPLHVKGHGLGIDLLYFSTGHFVGIERHPLPLRKDHACAEHQASDQQYERKRSFFHSTLLT